jgi:hypothetical protein
LVPLPIAFQSRVGFKEKHNARIGVKHLPLQDLDDWGAGGLVDDREARDNVASYGVNALAAGSVFAKRRNGLAGVATDANLRVDFNFTKEWYAEIFGHVLAFAVAENVDTAFAVRAVEIAHIFHYAENFDVHLPKHFDSFAYIGKRDD